MNDNRTKIHDGCATPGREPTAFFSCADDLIKARQPASSVHESSRAEQNEDGAGYVWQTESRVVFN